SGISSPSTVWMSHGDSVVKVPTDFIVLGSTQQVQFGAVVNLKKNMYGIQFHPEVTHTEKGSTLLLNFATQICNLPIKPKKIDIETITAQIKERVGDSLVIGAFSGGTDSVVAGALVARAIGKQFKPFYVDNGLMRDDTLQRIKTLFPKLLGLPIEIISAENEFLKEKQLEINIS
ncbi:MAG: GMP synthase (glutamine-hydrolyzing), partial [Candidatus Roizmanbacteria bacterium]|nr:GMP synthase (glutamine-hydrolyzing) [Candidatus Roizmanbacteria bacterium]